jgi:hypothetical protein
MMGFAGDLAEHACELGIDAAMVTGDDVHGGRDLRQRIRCLGLGYVLAARSNHRSGSSPSRSARHTDTASCS